MFRMLMSCLLDGYYLYIVKKILQNNGGFVEFFLLLYVYKVRVIWY